MTCRTARVSEAEVTPDPEEKVLWVGDDTALQQLLAGLDGAAAITLDTEFLADRSYTPRLCLLQVGGPDLVACVDPLADLDLEPLWQRLRDPDTVKVLHAAENDLALLIGPASEVPGPVFDSQIAAGLCGHGWPAGYATLCERLLGVQLDKSMQRTDWAARPLSPAAIRYAADDVRYLRDIHRLLEEELQARGRADWAREEHAALCEPGRYRSDPQQAWRRVRGREKLDLAQLTVLREIAAWRENTARSTNRPRRWVVPDDVCVGAASRLPQSEGELRAIRGFEVRKHGQHSAPLLALVKAARRLPPAEELAADAPPTRDERPVLEMVQAVLRAVADEQGVSAELLATGAEMLAAVRGDRDGRLFRGFRAALVGDLLAAVLAGDKRVRVRDGRLQVD